MKFFLSPAFAYSLGVLSLISNAGLLYYGHTARIEPLVAIACYIGLIAVIFTALFLSFVAYASRDSSRN